MANPMQVKGTLSHSSRTIDTSEIKVAVLCVGMITLAMVGKAIPPIPPATAPIIVAVPSVFAEPL